VALLTVGVTLLPGLITGLAAGYFGGWIDRALMILMDALLAFPALLLALALVALLGSGTIQIALAVGIAGIPAYARVTRAAVLEARTRMFIEAARSAGAGPAGILWRHVLPTIAPPLLAFAGVMLSWAILNSAPWVATAPGAALSLTVLAINLLAGSLDSRPGRE
jgi:peptide/nickel transport system permease protein